MKFSLSTSFPQPLIKIGVENRFSSSTKSEFRIDGSFKCQLNSSDSRCNDCLSKDLVSIMAFYAIRFKKESVKAPFPSKKDNSGRISEAFHLISLMPHVTRMLTFRKSKRDLNFLMETTEKYYL